ncbi:MAG: hypothetical protein AB7P00_18610 [Sandaracinaceae bacterium]
MTMGHARYAWLAAMLAFLPARLALAQAPDDAEPTEDDGADAGSDDSEVVPPPPGALPLPALPDGDDLPDEPVEPDPEEEQDGQVLLHIGDEPPPDPPPTRGSVFGGPRDVPFVVPGDMRQTGGISAAERPAEEAPYVPPMFLIGATAGWTRLLAMEPVDLLWLEQRFEVRIPDLAGLRVGAAVAEHWQPEGFMFEAGGRAGFGAMLFDDRTVLAEAVISLQLGYIGGDYVGNAFDLAGELDVRLQVPRYFELMATAGYSLFGTTSAIKVGLTVALTFL